MKITLLRKTNIFWKNSIFLLRKTEELGFKIVIITDFKNKLPKINKNSEIIAVMMPNIQGVRREKWQNYTTTIRNIEIQTSYDFFSNLPQELQDCIENKKWHSKP